MKATVTLNGTDKNPWHKFNLTRNPFPQHGKVELWPFDNLLADLDGDPIKNEADLRKRLKGASDEFVNVCIQNFQPGKRVRFVIEFPDE